MTKHATHSTWNDERVETRRVIQEAYIQEESDETRRPIQEIPGMETSGIATKITGCLRSHGELSQCV